MSPLTDASFYRLRLVPHSVPEYILGAFAAPIVYFLSSKLTASGTMERAKSQPPCRTPHHFRTIDRLRKRRHKCITEQNKRNLVGEPFSIEIPEKRTTQTDKHRAWRSWQPPKTAFSIKSPHQISTSPAPYPDSYEHISVPQVPVWRTTTQEIGGLNSLPKQDEHMQSAATR